MRFVSRSLWLPAIIIALGLSAPAWAQAPAALPATGDGTSGPVQGTLPPIPAGVLQTTPAPATPSPGASAPAAASAGAPAATPAAVPAAPAADGEQFDLKLKGLEEQVNDLKEKIFRTK